MNIVFVSNTHVKYWSKIQLFHELRALELHILYNYTVLQNHIFLLRPLIRLEFGLSLQGNGTGFQITLKINDY